MTYPQPLEYLFAIILVVDGNLDKEDNVGGGESDHKEDNMGAGGVEYFFFLLSESDQDNVGAVGVE